MDSSPFYAVDAVAAHLPFALDDIEAANAAFLRWHAGTDDAALRTVELWTYCFVRRYFLVKFIKEPPASASDLEAIVEKTFVKIERKRATVRQPDRYASWVSVVCKRTYLNYVRDRKRLQSLDDEYAPVLVADAPEPVVDDASVLLQVLLAAIARLPPFLQEVAHLRFVKEYDYVQMHAVTDRAVPTLRAYVNKAATALRKDAHLAELLGRELADP